MNLNMLKALPEDFVKQRRLLGLSQRKLGELAGITEQTIQRYEAVNYYSASLASLIKIAEVLEKCRDRAIAKKNN